MVSPRKKPVDHHERASDLDRWGDPALRDDDSEYNRRHFNPKLTKDEVLP